MSKASDHDPPNFCRFRRRRYWRLTASYCGGACLLLIFFVLQNAELSQDSANQLDSISLEHQLTVDKHSLTGSEAAPRSVPSSPKLFDVKGNDVIVHLHIQKTGGTTFEKALIYDILADKPCNCSLSKNRYQGSVPSPFPLCDCSRPLPGTKQQWLFSSWTLPFYKMRRSAHPDWTTFQEHLDNALNAYEEQTLPRNKWFITILRNPMQRYISEFKHIKRGATWANAKTLLTCNGTTIPKKSVKPCYLGDDWRDITLELFLLCPTNMAHNRQTRMLADLTLIGCYDNPSMTVEQKENAMLESAKRNLESMAYFGITERQRTNQLLFEHVFQMKFAKPFGQEKTTHASDGLKDITPKQMEAIKRRNNLDIQLYDYAIQIYEKRLQGLKIHMHD